MPGRKKNAKERMESMNYGFSKTTQLSFDDALHKAAQELQKESFGVITTIDIQKTMKNKLNVDFQKYIILGVCNPPLAYRALQTEEEIGLLLPCNVIVYEKGNNVVVAAFNPQVMTLVMENPEMNSIAQEVKARLERVIAAI